MTTFEIQDKAREIEMTTGQSVVELQDAVQELSILIREMADKIAFIIGRIDGVDNRRNP